MMPFWMLFASFVFLFLLISGATYVGTLAALHAFFEGEDAPTSIISLNDGKQR